MRKWVKVIVQVAFFPLIYRFFCIFPLQAGSVVLVDAHHDDMPQPFKRFKNELDRLGYLVVEDYVNVQKLSLIGTMRYIARFSKLFAQSELVFLCDHHPIVDVVKHRRGSRVVQLWHGSGAFKKFGLDSDEDVAKVKWFRKTHEYDDIVVSSEVCVPYFASAFGVSESRVIPLGVSRTDMFFDEEYKRTLVARFYSEVPEAVCKKVVLYAPTFRGSPQNPHQSLIYDIISVGSRLDDSFLFLYRLHPLDVQVEMNIQTSLTTEELLVVSDVLITDYSSIFYDYCLLRKPMILYVPDQEAYMKNRGFYMSMDEISALKCRTKEELYDALLDIENLKFVDEGLLQTYMSRCDGHATQRLLNYLTLGGNYE